MIRARQDAAAMYVCDEMLQLCMRGCGWQGYALEAASAVRDYTFARRRSFWCFSLDCSADSSTEGLGVA